MFKFLKDKLKGAISKISEGVEKEGKIEEKEVEISPEPEVKEEKKESKGFFAKIKETFTGKKEEETPKEIVVEKKIEKEIKKKEEKSDVKEKKPEVSHKKLEHEKPKVAEHKKEEKIADEKKHEIKKTEEKKEEITQIKEIKQEAKIPDVKIEKTFPKIEAKKEEIKIKETKTAEIPKKHIEEKKEIEIQKPVEEKKGFFESIKEKIITTKIDNAQFEKLFWEMELALMENSVAVEVIEKIKHDLKKELVDKPIRRNKVEETVESTLKSSIESLFENSKINLLEEIKNKKEKPYIIAFFGINGSGKTTSIAKLANMLMSKNISCVMAASDTFRAASIEQLQVHADKIGIKLIKHDYGADPAAVAFDAIKHAMAKDIDVVLIDTAGRMHSNKNLIDEMKKIARVAKPDIKIFVGESITGNDCVEQAKTFNEAVGIDGIILAKADIDEKGGAAISVSYVTKKPILYLGTGQEYKDLELFDKKKIIKSIGLD
ncbi:MAG: signal recognition particle-docking protein FtsY [Nanoarchaeota archaeon]